VRGGEGVIIIAAKQNKTIFHCDTFAPLLLGAAAALVAAAAARAAAAAAAAAVAPRCSIPTATAVQNNAFSLLFCAFCFPS
jgi:hypothetical protein